MDMLYCHDCHESFHYNDAAHTQDSRYEQSYMICPHCGSTELADVYMCDTCKSWVPEDKIVDGTDECEGCFGPDDSYGEPPVTIEEQFHKVRPR